MPWKCTIAGLQNTAAVFLQFPFSPALSTLLPHYLPLPLCTAELLSPLQKYCLNLTPKEICSNIRLQIMKKLQFSFHNCVKCHICTYEFKTDSSLLSALHNQNTFINPT